MEVTDVKITLVPSAEDGDGGLIGYAAVKLDDCFIAHRVRLVAGDTLPMKDGTLPPPLVRWPHHHAIFPTTTECMDMIQDAVLEAYYDATIGS